MSFGLRRQGARRLIVSMSNRRTEDSSTRQSLQVAKIAAMSKLAAGVAHEINNPCGVLLMKLKFLLSIAEQEHLSARAIATLEVAIQQTERIETIVESLVHFSRPLQGMPGPVDVNEAIQAAITQLQLPATVTVRQNLADPLPVVVADPAQMQQVFAHIMDNAVDAMPDGGHLTILSRREVDADQSSSKSTIRVLGFLLISLIEFLTPFSPRRLSVVGGASA